MEDLPIPKPPEIPTEKKDDKDKAKKKKSTESKDIGSFALGRKEKPSKDAESEKQKNKESLFGSLGLGEKKTDEPPSEQTYEAAGAPQELTESQLHGELTPEEVSEVQQHILQTHEAIDEDAAEGTEDKIEQKANQDVSDFRQLAAEKDLEMAFAEKLADMGVTPPESSSFDAQSAEEFESVETNPDEPQDFNDEEIPILRSEAALQEPDPIPEAAGEEPANPPVAAGAGGAGSPPRRPPNPLIPRATPSGPRGSGFYNLNASAAGGGLGAGFRAEYVPVHDETLLGILPGGIVGYLIGRRRGRIKTEKKLVPIQKKLEKQVKTLEKDITQKEQYIRKISRQQARERAATQTVAAAAEQPKEHIAGVVAKPKEVRSAAPEATQLHSKKPSPERIGHVLIGAEAQKDTVTQRQPTIERVERIREMPREMSKEAVTANHQAETMSRVELLALSEKITVDGSSLRQVYETRLVSEKGLRRLVQEHLNGGDIKKVLRKEIVEREIDFERDPILRDSDAAVQADASTGGGTATTLKELLEKADATSFDDSEEVAFLKARAAFESEQQTKQQRQRRVIDASFAGTIVILIILVTILILER